MLAGALGTEVGCTGGTVVGGGGGGGGGWQAAMPRPKVTSIAKGILRDACA